MKATDSTAKKYRSMQDIKNICSKFGLFFKVTAPDAVGQEIIVSRQSDFSGAPVWRSGIEGIKPFDVDHKEYYLTGLRNNPFYSWDEFDIELEIHKQ